MSLVEFVEIYMPLVEFVEIYVLFGRTKRTKNLQWEDQRGF